MVNTHPEIDALLKQPSRWLVPEKIIPAGFAALIVILLSMATVAYFSTVKLTADALSVQRANRVQAGLAALQIAINEAEIGQGRFTITGNDFFLEPFRLATERVATQEQSLRSLVDAAQREHLDTLLRLLAQRIELGQTIIDLRRNEGFDAARARIASGETRQLQDRIRSAIGAMVTAQENAVRQRENDTLSTARTTLALLAAAVVFALVAVSTALYYVQRSLKERSTAEAQLRESLQEIGAAKNRAEAFIARIDAALSNTILSSGSVANAARHPLRPEDESSGDTSEVLVNKLEEKGLLLKQANQDLAEREQRLQMALSAARMGTWDWDILTGKIVWSRGHEELWGMAPESFQGTYAEFDARLHPNDRDHLTAALQAAIDTGNEYDHEFRVVWPDGSTHWIGGRGHAIYDADKPIRMSGIVMNITERRRTEDQLRYSEARLRSILDNEPECVKLLAADGTLLDMNPAGLRMLEAESLDEVAGRCVYGLVLEADRQRFQEFTERVFRGESGTLEFEVTGLKGGRRWLETHASPLRDDSGAIVALLGVTRDITAREHAEATRQRLEAQLWQAQKMEALGTLAGGVAHDFNNILSAIIGNTELAHQDVGVNHPALTSLLEIRKASQRAKFLVQQILAFSRKQPLERRVLDLKPVIEECAAMLRATLPTSIELHVTCETDAPAVLADATQIHQVLLNLGTNAWHALRDAVGRIEIHLERATVDATLVQQHASLHIGEYARLTVSDNGVGMDETVQARIFEPFYTTKGVGQGSGLGLSVVDGIVKSHEGIVMVSSTPGTGSTFSLYFPTARDPASSPRSIADPRQQRGQGQHILYVDDDEALVTLVTKILERRGYRVHGYTQPLQALEALRAEPLQFDLVVTDYTMPNLSGLQLARQIAALRPDLPVILTSGKVDDDLIQRAREAGIREVLHKPNTVDQLYEAVYAAIPHNTPRALAI